MKRGCTRYIALTLAVAVTAMTSACAGTQIPLNSAADTIRVNKRDQYKRGYTVKFKEGETYSMSSEDITAKGDLIGIRYGDEGDYRYYSVDQIREITAKRKTYWAAGGGIGAGVGLAASLAGTMLGGKNCQDAGDPGDCEAIHGIVSIGAAIFSVGAGFGIGAAIGSAIPRKKKRAVTVNVSPKVYGTEKFKVNGGGIGVSGSF
jgi:hypothetical protein